MSLSRVIHLKHFTLLASRKYSTNRPLWTSVLDDPKINSSFDNPRRTIVSHLPLEEIGASPVVFIKNVNEGGTAGINSSGSINERPSDAKDSENWDCQAESAAQPTPPNGKDDGIFVRLSKRLGLYIDSSLPDSERSIQRTTRATKLGCFFVFGGLIIAVVTFCISNGRTKRDESGQRVTDAYSGLWLAPLYRITDAVYSWKEFVVEPIREKLLPDPLRAPYHQPKYTIVIEMKNVLINPEWTYKTGHRFKKRPALEYFLDTVGYPQFELVLYTSELALVGEGIVVAMDPKRKIAHHLFRDCNKLVGGHYVKDLSRLNRDLSKVIYIDYDPKSYQLNPENVLRVRKWEGDMDDATLVDLAELLKAIYISDTDDVRPILQYYSQFDDPAAEFRRRATMIAQQETEKPKEGGVSDQLKRISTNRFFGRRQYF